MPYQDPDRLAMVVMTRADQNLMRMPFSVADFLDWRAQNTVFEAVAAYTNTTFTLTGDEGPEQVVGESVTGDFFNILGIKAEIGRTFVAEEVRPGSPALVVISHSLWQRRLRGDPSIIGRSLNLNGGAIPSSASCRQLLVFREGDGHLAQQRPQPAATARPLRPLGGRKVAERRDTGYSECRAETDCTSIAGLNPKENANACIDGHARILCRRRTQAAVRPVSCGWIRPAHHVRQLGQPFAYQSYRTREELAVRGL